MKNFEHHMKHLVDQVFFLLENGIIRPIKWVDIERGVEMKIKVIIMIVVVLLLGMTWSSVNSEEIFINHGSIMLLIDPESGDIVFANNAAVKFYQYTNDELLHMNISEINMLSDEEVEYEMALAESEQRNYFLFRHQVKDGSIKDVEVYSYPIEYKGKTMLFSIVFDVTERLQAEKDLNTLQEREKDHLKMIIAVSLITLVFIAFMLLVILVKQNRLKYLARYDVLTGTYNRESMAELYNKMIEKERFPLTLCMVDVNNLKFVNDTYGHIIGDQLICKVAELLESFPCEHVVARVSGDEFVMMVPSCQQDRVSKEVDKMKKMTVQINGYHFNASIGYKMITEAESFETVFAEAERKMYESKAIQRTDNNMRLLHDIHRTLLEKYPEKSLEERKLHQLLEILEETMELDEETHHELYDACKYQDIGLLFTTSEKEKHVEKSYSILNTLHIIKQLSTICYHHHEQHDGKGYPKGLKGDDIPYTARILILLNGIYGVALNHHSFDEMKSSLNAMIGKYFNPDIYAMLKEDQLRRMYNIVQEEN